MELYIYTAILENPIVKNLAAWRGDGCLSGYYAACRELLNAQSSLKEFIAAAMLDAPPPPAGAKAYFDHDIEAVFDNFITFDWKAACERSGVLPLPEFPADAAEDTDYQKTIARLADAASAEVFGRILIEFYDSYACADEAKYSAFIWRDGRLDGVQETDDISFDDLAALGYKKDALIKNTEAFVNCRRAHDILLAGAAGTGKSSCVKAAFNMFRGRGLKLAELFKEDIACLPQLMDQIKKRKLLYIVFIDDLSFDGSDEEYKALKVTLDGRIEKRPDNFLLYATSNRIHLVRETWKDRDWDQDVHENETLHEKMSLSERFAIRLNFYTLSQQEYFEIIALLLKKHGAAFDDEMRKRAVVWETGGRSGRSAKQFVEDYLLHG